MCGLCTLFCSGSTVRVHPSLYIFVCCYVHTDRDSRMQRLKTLTILHIEELKPTENASATEHLQLDVLLVHSVCL